MSIEGQVSKLSAIDMVRYKSMIATLRPQVYHGSREFIPAVLVITTFAEIKKEDITRPQNALWYVFIWCVTSIQKPSSIKHQNLNYKN